MNKKDMLVVGCSFANGSGLPGEKENPRIWANQLAKRLGFTHLTNASRAGANNDWIFLETMSQLRLQRYDLVIVEWSAIPRYNFLVGLELYPTYSMLDRDINLVNNETIPASWLQDIKTLLLKLHNDHWDILNIIKYINILIELQVHARGSQIRFVNGLCPWPDQYFTKQQINLPSDLDSYTQDLLQVTHRDDTEIFQLYDMIHQHYQHHGGIQESYWLNLYASQMRQKIDTVSQDDRHPGFASQDLFAEMYYNSIHNQ